MSSARWFMPLSLKQADVLVGALSRYLSHVPRDSDEHAIAFLMRDDLEQAIKAGWFQ